MRKTYMLGGDFLVRETEGHIQYLEIDGRIPFTRIYISRYYARKANDGTQKVVKVEGGYRLMSFDEYRTWRNQK